MCGCNDFSHKRSCDDTMKKNGFTLIELIMAVVILGIVVLSVLNIFININFKNPKLEAVSTSLYLASAKLEEISNRNFNSITSESLTSFLGDFSDYNYSVQAAYVASQEIEEVSLTPTSYKWIKVFVSSYSLGSLEVSTLVSDASN